MNVFNNWLTKIPQNLTTEFLKPVPAHYSYNFLAPCSFTKLHWLPSHLVSLGLRSFASKIRSLKVNGL